MFVSLATDTTKWTGLWAKTLILQIPASEMNCIGMTNEMQKKNQKKKPTTNKSGNQFLK